MRRRTVPDAAAHRNEDPRDSYVRRGILRSLRGPSCVMTRRSARSEAVGGRGNPFSYDLPSICACRGRRMVRPRGEGGRRHVRTDPPVPGPTPGCLGQPLRAGADLRRCCATRGLNDVMLRPGHHVQAIRASRDEGVREVGYGSGDGRLVRVGPAPDRSVCRCHRKHGLGPTSPGNGLLRRPRSPVGRPREGSPRLRAAPVRGCPATRPLPAESSPGRHETNHRPVDDRGGRPSASIQRILGMWTKRHKL